MHSITCCILDMVHSNAFFCIQKDRFMLIHSPRDVFVMCAAQRRSLC